MSKGIIDVGGAVREGEELDIAAVDAWLKPHVAGLEGQAEVTQYSGGASNWTYRLEYPSHDLILRRGPAGTKAKGAHDMGREFKVQSALKPVFPYVPAMHAFCEDDSVLGTDFYVMDRLKGIIPRANMPRELNLTPETTREICMSVIDKFVDLHKVDYQAAGLEAIGKGDGYCRRQIDGWSARYQKAKTWNVPSFKKVMRWLDDNCPDDIATCVIHNDYRFDNVVLNPDNPAEVIGVLDWEMATLGDPLMDLGNSLAYWVQEDDDFLIKAMRRQPTHLPGMLTRQEVVDYYLEKSGLQPEKWAFYEVYGLFRLAVILQQIYYRYHHKQTRNPTFKNFWIMVNYLNWRCKKLIKKAG
ncbi:MAG: phosphotransferase family protein [Gammaproteobacteria bacterium]|nr:phosphotransferase family protein [Gammaproteobacteria bacterium]